MPTSPPARELAERIFAETAGEVASRDDALGALTCIYDRLERTMSAVIGEAGHRAIVSRALRRARTAHPSLEGVALAESDAPLEPLRARLRPEDASTVHAVAVTITANFIELLGTLIGAELTLTLLDREWPGLSATSLVRKRDHDR
jgi:hypothetical protein